MVLKFYTSVAKRLKPKGRKFWGVIPTFLEVIWEKLLGMGAVLPPPPPSLTHLNKLKQSYLKTVQGELKQYQNR